MSRSTERFHRIRVFWRWLKKYQVVPLLSTIGGLLIVLAHLQVVPGRTTEATLSVFAMGTSLLVFAMAAYIANVRIAPKFFHYTAWWILWGGFILFLISVPAPFGTALVRMQLVMAIYCLSFVWGHTANAIKGLFPKLFNKTQP